MLDLKYALGIAVFPLAFAIGGCSGNDTAINKTVQERLVDQGVADQVQVTTERRVVKLEGVVSSTRELNQAEIAARDVRGVLAVDNRLVVKPDVGITGADVPVTDPKDAPTPSHVR